MNCTCGGETKVLETRRIDEGMYRRRKCKVCEKITTTIEIEFYRKIKPPGRKSKDTPKLKPRVAKLAPMPVSVPKAKPPANKKTSLKKTNSDWKKGEAVRDPFQVLMFGEKK